MNSLSVKVIQRTYTETVRVLKTRRQWEDFRSKVDLDKRLDIRIQGQTVYVLGTLQESRIRRDTPIIWGIMIYELAREHMHRMIYTVLPNILWRETDSFATEVKYIRMDRKSRPYMYRPKLGQLMVEYDDKEIYAICISKKCCCLYIPADPQIQNLRSVGYFQGSQP